MIEILLQNNLQMSLVDLINKRNDLSDKLDQRFEHFKRWVAFSPRSVLPDLECKGDIKYLFDYTKSLINYIILNIEIYPVSSIILSYVMDPVMWDIKYWVPRCRYESLINTNSSHLMIVYPGSILAIQLYPKFVNFGSSLTLDGAKDQGDIIVINITGFGGTQRALFQSTLVYPKEYSISCLMKELTEDNLSIMTTRKIQVE